MPYIRSHQEIAQHPKTLELSNAMQWTIDTTIGKLHRLWWWCLDYALDGDLRKYTHEVIAKAVGVPEKRANDLITALTKAGWIDTDPYFRVHDWYEYVGDYLRLRYRSNPPAWQAIRQMYENGSELPLPVSNTVCNTVSNTAIAEQSRTELNRTEQSKRGAPAQNQKTPTDQSEVLTYFTEKKYLNPVVESQKFWNYYANKGWKVGKEPMKNWHLAAANWNLNNKERATVAPPQPKYGDSSRQLADPKAQPRASSNPKLMGEMLTECRDCGKSIKISEWDKHQEQCKGETK